MSPASLQAELTALETLGTKALGEQWEAAFGSPPPTACRPALLRRALGWHVQAAGRGRSVKLDRLLRVDPGRGGAVLPGTRLVREWQGRTHHVMAVPEGRYEYQGRNYRSLSAIAREITGTAWSGPLFFGLR